MRLVIAGSRGLPDVDDDKQIRWDNYEIVRQAVEDSGFWSKVTEVVSGTARGVDRLGEILAKRNRKKLTLFPAKWNEDGRGAGLIRNTKMANYADCLVAIWVGESRGTHHMISEMERLGKPVFVKVLD